MGDMHAACDCVACTPARAPHSFQCACMHGQSGVRDDKETKYGGQHNEQRGGLEGGGRTLDGFAAGEVVFGIKEAELEQDSRPNVVRSNAALDCGVATAVLNPHACPYTPQHTVTPCCATTATRRGHTVALSLPSPMPGTLSYDQKQRLGARHASTTWLQGGDLQKVRRDGAGVRRTHPAQHAQRRRAKHGDMRETSTQPLRVNAAEDSR